MMNINEVIATGAIDKFPYVIKTRSLNHSNILECIVQSMSKDCECFRYVTYGNRVETEWFDIPSIREWFTTNTKLETEYFMILRFALAEDAALFKLEWS